ncbi:MAG: hypothetical protein WCA77_06505, partial [Thermoplasmata archaeon]
MSDSAAGTSYLGGIGTMLASVETCPSCGDEHSEGLLHRGAPKARGCPHAVVGALPYLAQAE